MANPQPIKISQLDSVPSLSTEDVFLLVDESDKSSAVSGKTKKSTFGQIKSNILNSVVIPKATTNKIGGVSVGAGLTIDVNGQLRASFSGSWNDLNDKPTSVGSLQDLNDVTISTLETGQILKYLGTNEEDKDVWGNGYINFSEIANVPAGIVYNDSSVTLANLVLTGDLFVQGTTISTNYTTLNVGTNQIILNDQLGKYSGDAEVGSAIISNMPSTDGIVEGAEISIIGNNGDLTLQSGAVVTQIDGEDQIRISTAFTGFGSATGVEFEIKTVPASNASIVVNRSQLENSSLRWNELNKRWQFSNDGKNFYNLPTSSEYGDYSSLSNKPSIPANLNDLSDVNTEGVGVDDKIFLRYSGNSWGVSSIQGTDLSKISISALKDVNVSSPPTQGQVLKWDVNGVSQGVGAWVAGTDNSGGGGGINENGAIVTASKTGSMIPFFFNSTDNFGDASVYEGAIAYSEAGKNLYVAVGGDEDKDIEAAWVQLVKADEVSSYFTDTNTTYTISTEATTTAGTVNIKLNSSQANQSSSFSLASAGGVTITRGTHTNNLTISSKTYTLVAEDDTPADEETPSLDNVAVLKLKSGDTTVSTISFRGADGLKVQPAEGDPNSLVFRAPAGSGVSYTDNQAKTAAAEMITGGTHVGIVWSYDAANKKLSSTVSGGGGGGGTVVLYSLSAASETTGEASVRLGNSVNENFDSFLIAGAGGTGVEWSEENKKITISSTAPVQPDWNATDGLGSILNKPTIPSAYSLPVATGSTLGGIKIGSGLSIEDGVLNANPGGYTLPVATGSTLGGIKIGAGLSIENGVVSVSAGGGTPLQARTTKQFTTDSIQPNGSFEGEIEEGFKTYAILKITTTHDAWVRIYTDEESMVADRTRSEGNDPSPGSGLVAEARVNGTQLISPGTIGFNNDAEVSSKIYLSVTNRGSLATTITTTLSLVQLEA